MAFLTPSCKKNHRSGLFCTIVLCTGLFLGTTGIATAQDPGAGDLYVHGNSSTPLVALHAPPIPSGTASGQNAHPTLPDQSARIGVQMVAYSGTASGQNAHPTLPNQPVRVGVRVVAPFVMRTDEGSYTGITVALWEHIAREIGLEYYFVEQDIQGLLDGVAEPGPNALFAAASALTITAERESMVDFSHPFMVSGLGIAVPFEETGLWRALLNLFSVEFLWVILLLVVLLLFWALLVWVFERRANAEQFGGSPAEGIGSGFWWAAVTMTTVGYGDKAPLTLAGRITGFVWMFAGIILVSFFTASIASSLTVSRLDSRVGGPDDLPYARVGALEQSATVDWLQSQQIRHTAYENIQAGLSAVASGQLDAFVHDAPILRYHAHEEFRRRARVLPVVFNEQYYGIALPAQSEWRNDINQVMLEYIAGDEWQTVLRQYLGQ